MTALSTRTEFALPRKAAVVLVCVALAATLTACGSGTPTRGDQAPSTTSSSSGSQRDQNVADQIVPSPLTSYLLVGAGLYTTQSAEAKLEAACMKDFGFTAVEPALDRAKSIAEQKTANEQQYGVISLTAVQSHGYQAAEDDLSKLSPRAAEKFSDAYHLVSMGIKPGEPLTLPGQGGKPVVSPGSFGGKRVPPGGCLGAARTQLWGSPIALRHDNLAAGLRIDSYDRALADSQTQKVFQAWSKCMSGHGYRYSSPLEPKFVAGPNGEPSAVEIQTAIADVNCKSDLDLIRKWSSVVAEYGAKAIDKNQLALTEAKAKIDAAIKKASTILNGK